MSIEAIAAVGAQLPVTAPVATTAGIAAPPDANALAPMTGSLAPNATFAPDAGVFDGLVDSLGQIDSGMQASGRASTELALGQSDNLHQVMIAGERTRLQFELVMSMRNRVLEAYQEIMRMQV